MASLERHSLVVKKTQDVSNPAGVSDDVQVMVAASSSELLAQLKSVANSQFTDAHLIEVMPEEDCQAELMRILSSLGKLTVDGIPDREAGQALAVDFKIQGFLDVMAAKDPSTGRRFIVGQKPNWEAGGVAKVNIPDNGNTGAAWKVSTSDLAEDDLIDEEALLEEAPLPANTDNMDCGTDATGKRRACANCTCGLAELNAAEIEAANKAMTVDQKIVKASSCGNCAKGDAFRCASCPFLGKPAFEPGMEKVILSMGNDDI